MAFLDDKQRSVLVEMANQALGAMDNKASHELYREIVETLTRLCNRNQKEIAAELQNLAKSLESVNTQYAFEFKQRTCEVMLELNMEERRRSRLQNSTVNQDNSSETHSSISASDIPLFDDSANGSAASRQAVLHADAPAVIAQSSNPDESRQRTKIIGGSTLSRPPQDGSSSIIGASSLDNSRSTSSIPAENIIQNGIVGQSLNLQNGSEAHETSGNPALSTTFLSLDYLYMGSSDYEKDVDYYRDVLGAREVWKFDRFGSKITAFQLSAGPLLLIADHRKAPSCQPVFRVLDLETTARELSAKGWKQISGPFGTPNGEAYGFEDMSGNRFAIYQVDETSTDRAFFDPTEYD